jgi:hypothetical protein
MCDPTNLGFAITEGKDEQGHRQRFEEYALLLVLRQEFDRHPLASVATLVLGLRCSWCPESAPMPRILGLHALPPAAKAAASNL